MATKTTEKTKRQIRNPQKWVGKYVLHMDYYNWKWGERGYFVCEWTGKLYPVAEAWSPADYDQLAIAEAHGYDDCYYYGFEAADHFLAA